MLSFDAGYTPPETLGEWTHYSFVIDRELREVRAYINGVKQSNTIDISAINGSLHTTSPMSFGGAYGWRTDGAMDDLRVYDRVLSATEIQELYGNENGLVAHYTFDDGQAVDISGNGHHGTISGNPGNPDGVMGNAMRFDGDDRVDMPDMLNI